MNKNTYFFIILFFLFAFSYGQTRNFEKGKKYVIDTIIVKGLVSFQERTVVAYTGLYKGQEVTIPGEEISAVINKLWSLDLFSDINFYINSIEDNKIGLEIAIEELPKLTEVKFKGLKNASTESIIEDTDLVKGKKLSENFLINTKNFIIDKYKEKGFYNTKVSYNMIEDSTEVNGYRLLINVDKGRRVKINKISIKGNKDIKTSKILNKLKKTKQKSLYRFWKKSKLVKADYKEDLKGVIEFFKKNGYRDARIIRDSIFYEDNALNIDIELEEGRKYYFGDISFLGNSVYTTQQLQKYLGIQKGDVYNGVLLKERINDPTKPDGEYIANLYQNNGYLFSNINAVETTAKNDTVNFEIRVIEGKQAFFNRISIKGNDRTNDRVIYREIRTKPGTKYAKNTLIRSIRELGQLQFFDTNISPNFKNTDPNTGIVDIEFELKEIGTSQIQLQGGYGGGGFIGTLGLSFNNFSMKNLLNAKKEKTFLPMGDGQSLAIQLQATQFNRIYSFSFSEPWLGGKKPINFSTSISESTQYRFSFLNNTSFDDQYFRIRGGSAALSYRLTVPDDYFILSQALDYKNYKLNNYFIGLFTFGNGNSNNFNYTIGLTRNNTFTNPIYPIGGSQFSASLRLTPPYSFFNNIDYGNLGELPEFQTSTGAPDVTKIDQEKFRWLEFYKFKFNGTWFTNIIDKLVLRMHTEFGFIGVYNPARGDIPFGRFFLGGDGLTNFALDGREVIALRGYPNQSLSSTSGSLAYNKFSLEMRYPISLQPTASIYSLSFLELGNGFNSLNEFSPFNGKRSAGFGVRIFMPAFGLLGVDFGYGFDSISNSSSQPNGWETHFTIGQRF